MVARIFILLILLIVLPDAYIYRRYLRRSGSRWMKVVWCGQMLAMLVYTIALALTRDFTPQPQQPLNIYLLTIGVAILPKFIIVGCVVLGKWAMRLFHSRRNWGVVPGVVLAFLCAFVTLYGSTIGFHHFDVRRVDCTFPDLPDDFDGYRIALFSDAHVGSYDADENGVLRSAIDSINRLHPDVIFFLGDLQNTTPDEIAIHASTLSSLSAPDGVFSILGNHDYSKYKGGSTMEKLSCEKSMRDWHGRLGWRLLCNESCLLRHGHDSIVVAGLEDNEEEGADHGLPQCDSALSGVSPGQFIIMLAHNPRLWRRNVLPETSAQLTLSGHTHGGQVGLLGITTTTAFYSEDDGLYEENGRFLFVTRGLGALIPFRFNVTGEVVLLTLHKKH